MADLPIGWLGARGGTAVATWFLHFMASHLKGGTLTVVDDQGTHHFGDGLPAVTMVVHDTSVYWSTLRQGSVGLGRDYADGLWDCDDLTMLTRILNRGLRPVTAVQDKVGQAVGASTDWFRRFRPPTKHLDRHNIQSHYDVSNEFFALMLDETMMYSSAMFSDPAMSLVDAQRAKLDRLCTKLGLGPDDHVVEIGTGWGGFACHAAANYGCRVTTTTISDAQYEFASKRVADEGLADRVTVLDQDYRDVTGTYDKLVSIEMIEAVDWRQHDTFFGACADLLHDRGLMALQAITVEDRSFERAKNGTDFVREYIFPGGCLPSMEAITRSLRRATPLVVVDVEDIGRHYAETLRRWYVNLADRTGEMAALGLDTRFQRLWNFYLCYCEGAFLERHISDVQLVMAMPDWQAPMSVRNGSPA
ncbi:MAG: cyclopropane-fatty-acyl-phospholipid synthase family protein [Acidimicrobiales bacterium]